MYTFHEESPTAARYNELRDAVNWGTLPEPVVAKAIGNSLFSVVAKSGDRVVGFARVIGDGGLCFYIQEIIVEPAHQRNGIATRFMELITEYLERTAVPRSYIGVFVGKGLESFYSRYGFWRRPSAEMGPGMMQFWNDETFNRQLGRPAQ